MRKPRLHQTLGLLLLAACGGQPTTVVVADVTSVVLSPALAAVEVGLTVQFVATAFSGSGTQVTGQPVTWESTVQSVATIDSDGLATGVMAGSTQIRATIGGVTATETLTVSPPPCPSRTDVTLNPGEYAAFPGDECLLLPAGSVGDLYRVAIARPTLIEDPSNTPTVTLTVSPVLLPALQAATTPPPGPTRAIRRDEGPTIDGARTLEHLRMMDATRAFHMALRLRERALGFDPSVVLLSPASRAAAPPTRADPPATRNMFLDLDCEVVNAKAVKLIGFDDNLAIYQETAEWNTDPISPADADALLAYFASYVKAMIIAYWGAVPDTDENGRMIVVTSPSLEGAAAAVYSGDFMTPVGPGSCPSSNEGEVIYFLGDLLAALDDAEDSDPFALGVVAHEAKHVISLYHGILRPSGFNELWIEEGTADVSQVMSSRIAWAATGGPPLGQAITRADISASLVGNPRRATPEMSALVDELAAVVRSLSAQPNSVITDPTGAPEGHSFYANSWLWHRFLGDAFGNATTPQADSAFFRALTSPSTPAGGASGEILLTGRSFTQLFEDFVVAISLHGSAFSPTLAFTTWDLVSSADIFSNPNPPGSFPWPVTADDVDSWDVFAAKSYTGTMGPSGVRFHDFRSAGVASAQILVTGADSGAVIVTRIE